MELAIAGSQFDGEEFLYTPVTLDKIELVVNSSHRWNGTEKVSLEDLADETFIFREPGSGTDRTVRAALIETGVAVEKLNCKIFLGSNEAVKQAIRSGAGISFISRMSVKNECEQGELWMVKVEGLNISRHIYLASRQGRELSPVAKAFSSLLIDRYLPEGRVRNA